MNGVLITFFRLTHIKFSGVLQKRASIPALLFMVLLNNYVSPLEQPKYVVLVNTISIG